MVIDSKTTCIQRIFFSAPSINTIITSMEYNRYSRPYIILTSTTFDPFCKNYMDKRRQHIDNKVLIRDIGNANHNKLFRNRFQQQQSKPIIYVDFTQMNDSDEKLVIIIIILIQCFIHI